MSRQLSSWSCALLVLGACSVAHDGAPRRAPAAARPAVPIEATSGDGGVAVAAVQGPAERREHDQQVFAFWKDPEFQRRFTESYARSSDIEPTLTASEVELMNEVRELMANEDYDKAMSRLAGRQSQGASAVIDFTLGGLHFQRDELEPAVALFETAVQKQPRFRRAWQSLGLARMRLNRFEAAAQAFTRVLELGGVDALTYGLLAFANVSAGDHIAAESAYRMAAMLEPARLDWRMGLARAFFEQHRYAEAASLCEALIEKNPDHAELWMNQAKAYLGMKDNAKAAENLEFIDRLGKADGETLALLGDIYINENLCELASATYQRALLGDGKVDAARALRAARQIAARSAFAECKALLAAVEATHGAQLNPAEQKDVLKLRSQIAISTGAGEEEAQLLQQMIDLDPLDGHSLLLLGKYYDRNNDPDRAILNYKRAAELEAFAADAKLYHGQALARQGRYAEALPLLRSAQKLNERPFVQKFLEDVERAAQGRT